MGGPNGRESCGRCSFSTVVDAVEDRRRDEEGDADGETDGGYDPFDGGYIEIDERDLRLVSAPAIAAGRVKRWLDETAHRVIYGR